MKDEKQIIEEMAKDVTRSISWCNDVIPTVDCLGTAAALYGIGYRKQSGWISVDERLPKQWEMVLVFCDDIVSTDFISSAGRWFEHIDHNSVTHWMPLPEAPKGGAE